MAIIKELFKVIPPHELNVEKPKLHSLPRKAAEELVLAGVLLPILVSDIKAPVLEKVFAPRMHLWRKGLSVRRTYPPS